MLTRMNQSCIAAVAILIVCSTLGAQQQSNPTRLQAVEQTVEDVSPLSISLRDLQTDFRLPLGFQSVYRLPGNENLLMRSSGAVYAVFPQSEYIQTGQGVLPMIPAGTVFYIGLPPELIADESRELEDDPNAVRTMIESQRQSQHPSMRISLVDRYMPDDAANVANQTGNLLPPPVRERPETPDVAALVGPSIANDVDYREARLAELIRRAADAAGGAPKQNATSSQASTSAGE